jgi:hypothetical protein
MMSQPFLSKTLRLYDDEYASQQFRIQPESGRAHIHYANGGAPIEISKLTVEALEVHPELLRLEFQAVSEESRAVNAELAIAASLQSEATRASDEEFRIESEFQAESVRVAAREIFDASGLASEVAQRQSDVAGLTSTIASETLARSSADATHSQTLSDNKTRAISEEARIEQKFDGKISDLEQKNASQDATVVALETSTTGRMNHLQTSISNDAASFQSQMDSEVAQRQADSAALGLRVDNVLANTDPASLDSLAEIVSKFTTDGVTYADRLTNIESVLAALVNQFS